MRASRIRLLAAAGATLATLALTACEDGTGTQDEGASQPASTVPADTSAKSPSTPPSGTSADGTAANDPAQAGGGANGDKDNGKDNGKVEGSGSDDGFPDRVACNGSNTTVTVKPVPRPVNHMLITVKNKGSKLCDLTYYPVLRFDEMQWAPQPFEASKPQAVVSLSPGETAYAGVLLSAADGSGDGGTTGRKLAVGFHGATPNSDGGPSALPSLPAGGVYYDSSLAVTYWQQSMDDALTY